MAHHGLPKFLLFINIAKKGGLDCRSPSILHNFDSRKFSMQAATENPLSTLREH